MKVDELGEGGEGAGPMQTTTISSVKVDQPVGQSAGDADLIVCLFFVYCNSHFYSSIYLFYFCFFLYYYVSTVYGDADRVYII